MTIPHISVLRDLWDAVAHDKHKLSPTLPESALPILLSKLPAPRSGRPVVAVLQKRTQQGLPVVARAVAFWRSVRMEDDAERPNLPLTLLPTLLPQERTGDIPTPRLRAFWQAITSLREQTPRLILTTTTELEQPAPRIESTLGALVLKEKQHLSPTILAERLISLGYAEERTAHEPGIFARRGGILDVVPFHKESGIRIEFAGNTVHHVSELVRQNGNGADTEQLFARISETEERSWNIFPIPLPASLPVTMNSILENAYIIAEEGTAFSSRKADMLIRPFEEESSLQEPPAYGGNINTFIDDIKTSLSQSQRIIVLTSRPQVLETMLPKHENLSVVPAETAADARGCIATKENLSILTDADIGEETEEEPVSWDSGMRYARQLTPGKFVVHRDHGIAKFRGVERKELIDAARDYLVLEYAAGDRLFVPVEMSYKVTAYIGAANPVLHRLGGTDWGVATRLVKEETASLAQELLELYAARELQSGTAYPPDTEAEKKLEASFPYKETPDQTAAIRELKRDMERAQPMDRLVCGDVGFGKTEVAIRAAFKAVNFGRQAAVLAPTTLLAQQHFDTFQERLKDFGTRIAILSRFQKPAEQEKTIEQISAGEVDIIIGTHRLLSGDVKYKSLGLLIIDEEQKFGVEQKEKLRQIRANVDVLSLSATPIPRTLHMALSGLRSLTVIATPPGKRLPVITKVARENDAVIKNALEQELERGGQAYVLWNRVESIGSAAERIRKLVPHARIVVGHGQMQEQELMHVMEQFDRKQADILVCSTIIQNGIDLPNVNTLIVFDASSFGLSDLYQLRGRVGRADRQAYAYFLYRQGRLPYEARKRLSALLEAVELGSGWTLALRDLEIRGAGNLLGKEQHGTIRTVGVHLFGEMLGEEIERIKKGEPEQSATDVRIDIPVRAYLPETYIPKTSERLSSYTRIGSIRGIRDLKAAQVELENEYGQLPEEAEHFFRILGIKLLSGETGVSGITVSNNRQSAKRDSAIRERRVTITFLHGLTPTIAYHAIADNPRWTFTGSSMSMPLQEFGNDMLSGIEHTLRILKDAVEKEKRTGGVKTKR